MKIAIVTTTIFQIDKFLYEYSSNIKQFGHENYVYVYIVGDCKSPLESLDVAAKYGNEGINVIFLDIKWQRDYLRRFSELIDIIPENSDNRRNVGYLVALEEGADIIISVDDDNFPNKDEDFIGNHMVIGTDVSLPEAKGVDNWFNLCSLLNTNNGYQKNDLYPRGYPYNKRRKGTDFIDNIKYGEVAINVGLWTIDPDVDAISRLYASPIIKDWCKKNVFLGQGIRCPINTQNTALKRDAIFAYYYIRMGVPIKGMVINRFGDIFSGYFLQICADAVGDRIRIGSPVTKHIRNRHNLLIDLYNELAGIFVLEDISNFFQTVSFSEKSYSNAYKVLSYELEKFAVNAEGFIWNHETREFFKLITKNMRIWVDVCKMLI